MAATAAAAGGMPAAIAHAAAVVVGAGSGARQATRAATAVLLLGLSGTGVLSAQELEPGLYLNAPAGVNALAVNYGFSTGNVLVDSSLPLEGVHAKIHVIALGYLRTLALFGRTAKVDIQLPISWGRFEGLVAGEHRSRSPSGLADPRVRFAVNLLGSPALEGRKFATYRQHTILGASLQVALPIGQYDEERLINLGANRWSFRPEVGLSHRHDRWLLEIAGGAWVFTENDSYFGKTSLSQRALYFGKGSAIYTIKPQLWLSASYGHATGGETTIGGVFRNDLQRNDRLGATLSLPVWGSTSVKIAYTSGLATRLGGDFDSIGVTYQYIWR